MHTYTFLINTTVNLRTFMRKPIHKKSFGRKPVDQGVGVLHCHHHARYLPKTSHFALSRFLALLPTLLDFNRNDHTRIHLRTHSYTIHIYMEIHTHSPGHRSEPGCKEECGPNDYTVLMSRRLLLLWPVVQPYTGHTPCDTACIQECGEVRKKHG